MISFGAFSASSYLVSFVLSLIPARYRKPTISGNSHVLFSPIHFLRFEGHLLFGFAVLFSSSSSCFISPIRFLHFLHYQSYCSPDWVEMYNLSTLSSAVFFLSSHSLTSLSAGLLLHLNVGPIGCAQQSRRILPEPQYEGGLQGDS